MPMMRNATQQAIEIAEGYGGSSHRNGATLRLVFSREVTGDVGLRSIVSELYGVGVMRGDPAGVSPNFVDDLTTQPTKLSDNTSAQLGPIADQVIFDIRLLDMA